MFSRASRLIRYRQTFVARRTRGGDGSLIWVVDWLASVIANLTRPVRTETRSGGCSEGNDSHTEGKRHAVIQRQTRSISPSIRGKPSSHAAVSYAAGEALRLPGSLPQVAPDILASRTCQYSEGRPLSG